VNFAIVPLRPFVLDSEQKPIPSKHEHLLQDAKQKQRHDNNQQIRSTLRGAAAFVWEAAVFPAETSALDR